MPGIFRNLIAWNSKKIDMSSKAKQIHRRYEDELERRSNKAHKIQQRELAEKQYSPRRVLDIINTDEDDYSDIHDPWEDDYDSQ